jgi:aryl-phospho-beta-D-glucosidase BglC (GH1 family)
MNRHQLILLVIGLATISGVVYHQQNTSIVEKVEETAALSVDLGRSLALPNKLVAGEVHYSRIPVEYWEHRLQLIKSMGFNTLSVYIMWNYHETEKGKFDYQTGNKNLSLFLELAKKYDLYVLIRPGPYVCAEWDLGGFPARLLNVNGLKFRANNQVYLN